MNNIVRLQAINRKLDRVIHFAYDDDDDDRNKSALLKTGVTAGAVGAGAGGAYLLDRSIMNRYGKAPLLPGSATDAAAAAGGGSANIGRLAAYRSAGRNILGGASSRLNQAVLAGSQAAGTVGRTTGSGLQAALAGLRKSGKYLFRG